MHQKRLYGTATIGTKGQIVIPAKAREELGLETGEELFVIGGPGTHKMLVLLPSSSIEGFLEKIDTQMEQFDSLRESYRSHLKHNNKNDK